MKRKQKMKRKDLITTTIRPKGTNSLHFIPKRKMRRKDRMVVTKETGVTLIEESFLPDTPKKMKRKYPSKVEIKSTPPEPEKPKKILYPSIIIRKDGKPNCYVCSDPLNDLRDLKEMKGTSKVGTDYYNRLSARVVATIVTIGKMGRTHNLYRCVRCEPGSSRYKKNGYLRKLSKKFNKEL